jgi:hypothetical protein
MENVCVSRHQNAEQNDYLMTANAAKFKCLGKTVTNKNYIYEEIKSRL